MVFYIGWFGDTIFLSQNYSKVMRNYLGSRLPSFTSEELGLLQKTAPINAFYGMNHYSTKYARQLSETLADDDWTSNVKEGPVNSEGHEIGPASAQEWLRIAP
jgi:beta-glucosidase